MSNPTSNLQPNPGVPPLTNDDPTTRLLWEALFAVTHAVEHLGLDDEVDKLVNERWALGAHAFARFVLSYSILDHPTNLENK